MKTLIHITVLGLIRDRVLQAMLFSSLLMLLVPTLSAFSMRQVTELSITLSLSFVSLLLLLIAVFLGSTSLWRDIERRYTISVLSLPLSRTSYVLAKYCAIAIVICAIVALLGFLSLILIQISSGMYPPGRPIAWDCILLAYLFTACKYLLLSAFAFLFSSFSTSFFLPVFGTLIIFFVGSGSQQVYDFINSQSSAQLPAAFKSAGAILYFLLPNFSAFDLTVHAVYSIPLSLEGILLTSAYFIVYSAAVLSLAAAIFSRREIR